MAKQLTLPVEIVCPAQVERLVNTPLNIMILVWMHRDEVETGD